MQKSHLHHVLLLAAIASCGLSALPAAAQTMKPGLWEITNKMGGSGDSGAKMAAAMEQMQKQMASMSPEQRKQMEKMMAQQGVNMSPGAGGGMSTRICITKEMAARNEAPAQHQGDCKQEQMQKSGNTTKFKFTCTKPPSTGEGEVTVNNAESYTMKMKITRDVKGKPEQMTMDAQGRFVASDCGSVKPIAAK
ncbi:MAG: DUF3617 domain-containing protein [Burkholderiales bacterium]|nr:DUF3617 domain-containing protein [Burkholderiales bacterium]